VLFKTIQIKKKKSLVLLCVFSLCFAFVNAQENIPTDNQNTHKEIEQLFKKYENTEKITVFTPQGDLEGDVKLFVNKKNEAKGVKINGVSTNKSMVIGFISYTLKLKQNQGYTLVTDAEKINAENQKEYFKTQSDEKFKSKRNLKMMLTKGKMLFKMEVGKCADCPESSYSWEIETIDTDR
jgi:hypothetical protein